jgi:bidirectional [NiFe] hydrogenase diaphorase subunit
MVKFTIDGRKVEGKEESVVLKNAREMFIDIPTLCYHDELSPFGACRLCTVEIKVNGKWQLAASCTTKIASGMEIKTNSEKVQESRKMAAELLYYKYPETKAVRDIAQSLGVAVKDAEAKGSDCVLCGLCTRTCHEVVGVSALTFQDRGLDREIEETKIDFCADACIGCGSCAYVCPTGFVKMETVGDKRMIWDKVFKMASCEKCGRYFAPLDQLEFISKKTGVALSKLMTCVSCR